MGELSDFHDSDYNCNDSDMEGDNALFDENVDVEPSLYDMVPYNRHVDEPSVDVESHEEMDSTRGSDDDQEKGLDTITYNESTKYDPHFVIGQRFRDKNQFKEALDGYAVKARRNVKIPISDPLRSYARCCDKACKWGINLVALKDGSGFMIRSISGEHTCLTTMHVDRLKSGWLAKKYENFVRNDPRRRAKGLMQDMSDGLNGVTVTKRQVYKAKSIALRTIEGDVEKQYESIQEYGQALLDANPGSTVIVQLDDVPEEENNRRFKSMYICFKALRDGFMEGCRPLIGLDGCHLTGPNKGILLTAVSIDANNNLYPICYAVVGQEDGVTWEWFLLLLKEEFNSAREDQFTFITDRQKGLTEALKKVFEKADKRFCVRHMHENMKNAGYRGPEYKLAMWSAAMATTTQQFDKCMQEISEMNPEMLEWLKRKKVPSEWSRSHFGTIVKCDILLNNMCESFNASIVEAREKFIIPMLEWIRHYLMARLQARRDYAQSNWVETQGLRICPRIKKILGKTNDKIGECISIKADEYNYEIRHQGHQFVVDLKNKTCNCRRWELTGIPCVHACRAIAHRKEKDVTAIDYVDNYYTVETFQKSYAHSINPMPGPEMWKKTSLVKVLPPTEKRGVGRPKKARRRQPDELSKKASERGSATTNASVTQMPRQPHKVKCSVCGGLGHNARYHKKNASSKNGEATPEGGAPPPTSQEAGSPQAPPKKNTTNRKKRGRSEGTSSSRPNALREEMTQVDGPPPLSQDGGSTQGAPEDVVPKTTSQNKRSIVQLSGPSPNTSSGVQRANVSDVHGQVFVQCSSVSRNSNSVRLEKLQEQARERALKAKEMAKGKTTHLEK